MHPQQTLSSAVEVTGVGLHTGAQARVRLAPADAGHGVAFVRVDVRDRDNVVPARVANVSTTQLGTNITNSAGVTVATVEHLLSACSGLGLDNAVVELDGPEAPILEGSAETWAQLIARAGLAAQSAPRRRLRVLKPVAVTEGAKRASLAPSDLGRAGLELRVAIDFPSRAIGAQSLCVNLTPESFAREIAPARTFGFASEIEKLRSLGLARGGSMENAIVVDGDDILNPDGLRTPDEFVRHKTLDAIGDLYLAGGPIDGVYEAHASGHALNVRLLRTLFDTPDAFAWTTD